MSEENKSVQEPEVSESTPEVNLKEENEKLKKALEDQINMIKGLDRKVTELQQVNKEKEKVIAEKDQTKKSLEDQFNDLKRLLEEKDLKEKQKEKESLVHKVIAETKLNPEFDFDFLNKFETEEMIKEKALERAEYYNKLKEDGFKERAGGTVPVKGTPTQQDLSKLGIGELNQLAIDKPEMKPQIIEAIKNRS